MFSLLPIFAVCAASSPIVDATIATRNTDDPKVIKRIISVFEIEEKLAFPPYARGILLAWAQKESKFFTKVRGDCKQKKPKRGCRAVGMFQFWPWAKKGIRKEQRLLAQQGQRYFYGDPRLDWEASAYFAGKHFMKQLAWVQRVCKHTSKVKLVQAAEATAVWTGRGRPYCGSSSSHGKLWAKWKREIAARHSLATEGVLLPPEALDD